jgi:type I restriction enzyme, S subunit
MKESDAPWLGEVPDHWSVLPNRALFAEIKDRNHPEEEMLSVTITKGVVKQKELLADSSKKDSSNLDRSAYKLVQPRDIAYNKMRAWQGAIGASDYRGIISPAYVVMRLRSDANPRYFHHLYRTPQFAKEAERWSYGITSDMWSLRPEHFRLIYSPFPPPDEQDVIVRFADYADRRIRNYIRVKLKFIKLLEEQKKAIIQRAVTRGLDPNPVMRSGGLDWLRQLPEGWCIARLGCFLTRIEQGWSPVAAEGDVSSGQYSVLTLSAIKRGRFSPQAIKPISTTADIPTGIDIHDGDFLLSRSNTRDLVGDVCIVDRPEPRTIFPDLIYRLSLDLERLKQRFLMYVLLSSVGRRQIERDARGSSGTMPKISQGHIRSWRIPLPKPGEQLAIISSLDHQTTKLNKLISLQEDEIELMQRLGTRLVADVVTGQLDVRRAGTKLSEGIHTSDPEVEGDETTAEGPDTNETELGMQANEAEE